MMRMLLMTPVAIVEGMLHVFMGLVGIITEKFTLLRVRSFRSYSYLEWLKRDLADCESILELGCGLNSPILKIGYGYKTDAADIWRPYVDQHKRMGNYHNCEVLDILGLNSPVKSYDAVVLCDVLEHLPRQRVMLSNLFARLEKIACKKVILFTPNGYVDNDEVDGDPYQAHLSAWEPVDYIERGYSVRGATGLRHILGKASLPKYHPYSVFAIIAMVSQPIIFNRPNLAWHSYAVKEVE